MTELRNPFNWSDAWLLLAVWLANKRAPATLENVIAAGDQINFAILSATELESGLVRLTDSGYIVEDAGTFSLTGQATAQFDALKADEQSLSQTLMHVQNLLGAAAAPDLQPCVNNLKYPGFSQKEYEEAVTRYQGYLR